jgi:hypothetical protein
LLDYTISKRGDFTFYSGHCIPVGLVDTLLGTRGDTAWIHEAESQIVAKRQMGMFRANLAVENKVRVTPDPSVFSLEEISTNASEVQVSETQYESLALNVNHDKASLGSFQNRILVLDVAFDDLKPENQQKLLDTSEDKLGRMGESHGLSNDLKKELSSNPHILLPPFDRSMDWSARRDNHAAK